MSAQHVPAKDYLNLLPLLPEGGHCKHTHHWCIKFNGEFYAFENNQFGKDAWVAETRSQLGLLVTMQMLHRYCPKCRTVQTRPIYKERLYEKVQSPKIPYPLRRLQKNDLKK